MMIILLLTLMSILELRSAILSSTQSGLWKSTHTPITTAHKTCPCDNAHPKEQCLLDEMFQSISFFKDGTTKLVCQNVSATVKSTNDFATIQTMSQFESFNANCLAETNESNHDYLSLNGSSQCSPSYKCCVMCSGCAQKGLLNDEGPIVLKDIIDNSAFKTNHFSLLIKCATTSPQPTAGFLFFEVRFSNGKCNLTQSSSIITPKLTLITTATHEEPNTMAPKYVSGLSMRTLQTSTYQDALSTTGQYKNSYYQDVSDTTRSETTKAWSATETLSATRTTARASSPTETSLPTGQTMPATGKTVRFSSATGINVGSSVATRKMVSTSSLKKRSVSLPKETFLAFFSEVAVSTTEEAGLSSSVTKKTLNTSPSTNIIPTQIHASKRISLKSLKRCNAAHILSAKIVSVALFMIARLSVNAWIINV